MKATKSFLSDMANTDFSSMLAEANFAPASVLVSQDKASAATEQKQSVSIQDFTGNDHWLNRPEDGTPSVKNGIDEIAFRLSPSDITPENRLEIQDFARKFGVDGPVAVYVNKHDRDSYPNMALMTNEEGKPAVLINEAAHKWTASYVDAKRDTDALVASQVADGMLTKLTAVDLPRNVAADLDAISAKMGNTGQKSPALYVDNRDKRLSPDASSYTTREGKNVIVINKAELDELKNASIPSSIPESTFWHEEAHFSRKDNASEKFAAAHNTPGLGREKEIGADKLAFGPDGSNDAGSFLKHLEIGRNLAQQDFKKVHPNGTAEQFESFYSDSDHPTFAERKAYLQDMIKSQGGGNNRIADSSVPTMPIHSPSVDSPSQSFPLRTR